LDKENPKVYAYTRGEGAEKVLVILNFSKDKIDWSLPAGLTVDATPLINNYQTITVSSSVSLEPYQAVILKVH
jgi:oligo-1,6-glucosidase